MTERTPPAWLQSGSYTAEDDRRLLSTIFGDSEGIIHAGDLAVTQRGAGANMSVDIAGGRAVVKGDLSTYEGVYFMENRGVTNLAISASDPTNPRIDRVVAEVLNAEYSGASNLWRLRVITGTAAPSPVAPALPDNCISLATVAVAALASSITNANITDARTRASILRGTVICTSTTRPAVPFEGLEIYETDTDKKFVYTGSVWVCTAYLGAYDAFTNPVITQPGTITRTVTSSEYTKIGRNVKGQMVLSVTGAGTANNAITVSMPFTARYGASNAMGTGYLYYAAGNTRVGFLVIAATTTTFRFSQTADTVNPLLGQTGSSFAIGLAAGDAIVFNYDYEAAS